MPVFAWRALTPAGRAHGGVIDAESGRAACQALRARGVWPTDVREAAPRGGWRPVGAAERALVLRQLATLVRAGVPLAEALVDAGEGVTHPALGRALALARGRLGEGEPLARALGASPRVFPPLVVDLVQAGEASGALPAVLLRLAEHAERTAALQARLRAALTYPAVMLAATAGVTAFLVAWVVPEVTRLFAETGTALPLATRTLLAVTWVARRAWWLVLPGALVAGVALSRWRATPAGRAHLDAALLRLPLLGRAARAAAAARFARTLATLLAGGVPLETALGIAGAAAGNARLGAAVAAARARVREGEPLAAALAATGELPGSLVRLAAVGERSGTLAETLAHAADAAEAETERTVGALTALVEPALVLVMGGVVLALVLAILVPLFDLAGLVR